MQLSAFWGFQDPGIISAGDGSWILRCNRLFIDRVSHKLFIGEDVTYGPKSPSSFSPGTRDAKEFEAFLIIQFFKALKP
jgi:hypothetical protein